MEGQLNKVNSLNRDELKELYRQVMDTEQFSSKGGAGFGLIDIARKSGEKIDFSFNDLNDDYDEDVYPFYIYALLLLMILTQASSEKIEIVAEWLIKAEAL